MKTVDIYDIHIQYALVCPSCDWIHWLSEPQYNDNSYHVTCDCGTQFKPNRINKDLEKRTVKHKVVEEVLVLAKLLTEIGIPMREAKIKAQKVYSPEKKTQDMIRDAMLQN